MSFRPRTALLAALALSLPCAQARAQRRGVSSLATTSAGTPLRVWSPETGREGVNGHLVALSSDTLRITVGKHDKLVNVPVADLRRIDVSEGRASRKPTMIGGMFLGAIGGAGLGYGMAIVAQSMHEDCPHCHFGPTEAEKALWDRQNHDSQIQAMEGSAVAGALIGMWFGSRMHRERWLRLDEPPVRTSVVPTTAGARITLSVGF